MIGVLWRRWDWYEVGGNSQATPARISGWKGIGLIDDELGGAVPRCLKKEWEDFGGGERERHLAGAGSMGYGRARTVGCDWRAMEGTRNGTGGPFPPATSS